MLCTEVAPLPLSVGSGFAAELLLLQFSLFLVNNRLLAVLTKKDDGKVFQVLAPNQAVVKRKEKTPLVVMTQPA